MTETVTVTEEQPTLPDSEPVRPGPAHCRVCGHPLRDRVSRIWGLGPDCRDRLRLRLAPRPPDVEIEQDPLPGTGL